MVCTYFTRVTIFNRGEANGGNFQTPRLGSRSKSLSHTLFMIIYFALKASRVMRRKLLSRNNYENR